MITIYILKLEHDCYYIGKTNNYSKRIKDHLNNSGALWTKLLYSNAFMNKILIFVNIFKCKF